MSYNLTLTPAGHLHLREGDGEVGTAPDAWTKRVATAFSSCQASGLFALAATKPDVPPSPPFSFWRDFACRYLTQLCRTPESTRGQTVPIEPPLESELATMLLCAPPMQGGEYLSVEVFHGLWFDLDFWVQKETTRSENGRAGWLKAFVRTLWSAGWTSFPR